jgi:hypothetical protein
MNDYSKLETLAKAATPGPWEADNSRHEGSVNAADRHIGMVSMYAEKREDIPQNFANQEFIAAANPAVVLELIAENKGYAKKIKWDESWYGARFETLFHWAHRELNEEQKTQYFNIVANGSSSPLDPPTYAQQMNILKGKVTAAEKERDQLKAEVERLKHENSLLTEHNEFLASSDSRLAPELRAVKDTLGLDFTASVIGEVVPAIQKLRKNAERYQHLRKAGLVLEGHDFISYDEIADYRVDCAMAKAEGI